MQGLGITPISSHQEWRNGEGLVSIWRRGNLHCVSLSMSPRYAPIVTTSQEHAAFLFCLLISQVPRFKDCVPAPCSEFHDAGWWGLLLEGFASHSSSWCWK